MSETSSTSPKSQTAGKNLSRQQIVVLVGLSIVVALGFLLYNLENLSKQTLLPLPASPFAAKPVGSSFQMRKFASDAEFQDYMQQSQNTGAMGLGMLSRAAAMPEAVTMDVASVKSTGAMMAAPSIGQAESANRVSETNVQVAGIDEPDIVKTNGKQLYFSTESVYMPMGRPVEIQPMMLKTNQGSSGASAGSAGTARLIAPVPPSMPDIYPPLPSVQTPATQILAAFPPAELAKLGKIDSTGQLLLSDQTLIVISTKYGQNTLTGYDVKTPSAPKQTWQVKVKEGTSYLTARLKDGEVYLVTQTYLSRNCPIQPLMQTTGEVLSIPCTDVYHPDRPMADTNTTYTITKLNATTGKVDRTTSIVGSTSSSVVYMAPDSIYLTYRGQTDMVEFLYGFLSTQGQGLFPDAVVARLEKLRGYDISSQAKMVELQQILQQVMSGGDKDQQLKLANDLQNRMKDYLAVHRRELEQTLIVRLSANNLVAESTGSVPGYLLNQFSLDEYQGNLRVATTFGQAWTQFGRPESASDVYVLDSRLRQRGVVEDLGKGERIYSVRFLGEMGYVVTFKQTDPFYVLDLRNPDRPQKTGELKIPGYSSYLHPLTKNRVLGIGKEGAQVKVSLFDVSDPTQPKEAAKYTLDEYWSEALNNHHAFLQDEKHQVFFMPASKGGYIFSYAEDQLTLVKAVSQNQVKRAVFIGEYLYVLGDQGVTVLRESDWQIVKEMGL